MVKTVRTIKKKAKKVVEVKGKRIQCAFCNGTGKDPFGVMSKLSDCPVCFGRGQVWVEEPSVKCPFCKGTGIQPLTFSRLQCATCRGKGRVKKIEPAQTCPKCGGTGIWAKHALQCYYCKGMGVIPKRR